jgi:hypothetical protein
MTTYLLIAAAILLALIAGAVIARWLANKPTPKVVLDAESEAWAKLEELIEFAADSKGDQKAIVAAQQRIAQRQAQVAAFKAKVAALGS